jgi:hypothetical protein
LWRDIADGKITAMTGILILTVFALAIVAALEISNRRNSVGPRTGLNGGRESDDRDVARTKLDLLALAGRAAPFTRKPFETDALSGRRARHFNWQHGRHAA